MIIITPLLRLDLSQVVLLTVDTTKKSVAILFKEHGHALITGEPAKQLIEELEKTSAPKT